LNLRLMTSETLRKAFLLFAATQCAGYSPLYERLAIGIADDELLLELVMSAAPSQQRPTLLFAAVHELVVQEPRHPWPRTTPASPRQSPTTIPCRHSATFARPIGNGSLVA
jgi:hypothetical protein